MRVINCINPLYKSLWYMNDEEVIGDIEPEFK